MAFFHLRQQLDTIVDPHNIHTIEDQGCSCTTPLKNCLAAVLRPPPSKLVKPGKNYGTCSEESAGFEGSEGDRGASEGRAPGSRLHCLADLATDARLRGCMN